MFRIIITTAAVSAMLGGCKPAENAEAADQAQAVVATDAGDIAAPLEAGAVALPHLRAGLWRVTKTDNGVSVDSSMCLNDAVQEKVSVFGMNATLPFCPPAELRRKDRETWTMTTLCPIMDMGSVKVDGEIKGDMRTHYTSTYRFTSTAMGETTVEESVERGRHAGACPSDMAPGDIIMAGGLRMTFDQVMAMGQTMMPGMAGPAAE